MSCNFCDETIYVKVIKFSKSLAAPLTKEEELRQKLEDLTGITYVRVENNFCPICGEKLHSTEKGGEG